MGPVDELWPRAAAHARDHRHRVGQDRGLPAPDSRSLRSRERDAGRGGIKALVLYPMNALASDQAAPTRRSSPTSGRSLDGITAGLYIGGDGRAQGADGRITSSTTGRRCSITRRTSC